MHPNRRRRSLHHHAGILRKRLFHLVSDHIFLDLRIHCEQLLVYLLLAIVSDDLQTRNYFCTRDHSISSFFVPVPVPVLPQPDTKHFAPFSYFAVFFGRQIGCTNLVNCIHVVPFGLIRTRAMSSFFRSAKIQNCKNMYKSNPSLSSLNVKIWSTVLLKLYFIFDLCILGKE